MKIKFQQFFFGKKHSWAVVGAGIATSLINSHHTVEIYSTDGITYTPEHLKSHIIGYTNEATKQRFGKYPTGEYDMQFSYTAPHNAQYYLAHGKKNRFLCWSYEWLGKNILPNGFAKCYKHCDLILPPSQFSKQIFLEAGVPDSVMRVIPHGIDPQQFSTNDTIDFGTTKRCKILCNLAQTHIRKNIPGMLDAYGKAFTKQDDICLIIKAKLKEPKYPFDADLGKCIKDFNSKYPEHAEIKVYEQYIDNIATIYNSVDIVFTMTHCEGYYLPAIEALAVGKVNIAPRWGGQIDFLNDDNALLVEGKEERADPNSMYWERKPNAIWFRPSIDDAVDKLRYAYNNYETLNAKLAENAPKIREEYSWDNITKRILDLCN